MILTLALLSAALAADFAIDWYTIDGGGEMSSSAGDFELTGGFWVVAAATSDPCAQLTGLKPMLAGRGGDSGRPQDVCSS